LLLLLAVLLLLLPLLLLVSLAESASPAASLPSSSNTPNTSLQQGWKGALGKHTYASTKAAVTCTGVTRSSSPGNHLLCMFGCDAPNQPVGHLH
jgi:hypothetical protein